MRAANRRTAFLVGLVLLLPAIASADDAATAAGKWVVDGKSVEIRYAVAFREPEPFGRGTSPCVLASNEPVPAGMIPVDDDAIARLVGKTREGTLRALEVCFDASGRRLRDVNDVVVFHPGISPGRHALQGFHEYAPRPAAPGRLAGRLTGSGDTDSGGKWSDTLDLAAPLPPEK
jgi:hypothetical protein